jgi:pimeloyl-ACP methyl ester carboxylesterase
MGNLNETKKAIVFIHGDLQNHTSFKKIETYFKELGHQTFTFDLPGHGNLKFSDEMQDLPKYIEETINNFNLDKPIIVGHSTGGILAVNYTLKTNNVSSLILLNSTPFSPKLANPNLDWEGMEKQYLKLSEDNFNKQELIDYSNLNNPTKEIILGLGLKSTDPKGFKNNINFYTKDISENNEIFNIDIPVLFISDENDPLIKADYVKNISSKMKNSKTILTNDGHNAPLTNPENIISMLKNNYPFFTKKLDK